MFRRTDKSAVQSAPLVEPKDGGKGRPTPTRKEAQAAARERARTGGMDKKTASKVLRDGRSVSNAQRREGMKNGDPRYMLARDKGPVRHFIRDYVDCRLVVGELMLPMLIVVMVLQYSGNAGLSGGLMIAAILVVLTDSVWLRFRLRKELRRRFPKEPLNGTTFYALTRVLQVRFLRMPKPQVKIGQQLPERY